MFLIYVEKYFYSLLKIDNKQLKRNIFILVIKFFCPSTEAG